MESVDPLDYLRLVALVLFWYLGVVAVIVVAGVVFGLVAKRGDVMDEAQARVFGGVRVSPWMRLPGLVAEVGFQALAFFMQGLHRLRLLPIPRGDGGGPPVLVIHGYTENAGTMWLMARGLRRRGFDVVQLDFPSTFAPMESNVTFLRDRIAEIRAAHGGEPVAVVAHSMGGVVTRALTLSEPDHGVRCLIAIASPFRGTYIARLGHILRLGLSTRDMSIGSAFMQRYSPDRKMPVPAVSIVAMQEDIVVPEWSVVVDGLDVQLIPWPYGHLAPCFLPSTCEWIAAWLDAAGVARQGRPPSVAQDE
ncbi:MAG: alpha/beta hydrolase [Myxococcales bacterium]|jgi:pimeloyl-ACP methyl ester carboxylesterase